MGTNTEILVKLENTFLSTLRVVILFVLSISLLSAIYFVVVGSLNFNAYPKQYEPKTFKIDEFSQSTRDTLLNKHTSDETRPAGMSKSIKNNQKDFNPIGGGDLLLLQSEISDQNEIVQGFLTKVGNGKHFIDEVKFKVFLKDNAENLSEDPQDFRTVLNYAKGQTEFFKSIFNDKKIIDFFQEQSGTEFDENLNLILDSYPDYFRNKLKEMEKFESDQNAEMMSKKAGSLLQLYIAGGLFATFLLISLILVLIKIERNLRPNP